MSRRPTKQEKRTRETVAMSGAKKGKKEMRLGCLWGILLPLVYTLLFIVILLVIPHEPVPPDMGWFEYLGVLLKFGAFGFIALVVYLVLLVPILIVGFVLGLRDPSVLTTLKVSWPFLLALVYILSPDLFPGPIDDIIVTLIASGIGAVLLAKASRRKKEDREIVFDKGEPLEVQVVPREKEQSTAMEKPKEIIDVEFEDKS
jgi:hypothetical protein